MSSAEDVEAGVEPDPDDRLSRAFDRAARLGIELEPDEALSERESAAVRAFTALHRDPGPAEPPPGTAPPASTPPDDAPAGVAPPHADRTAPWAPAPGPPADRTTPWPAAPGPPTAEPADAAPDVPASAAPHAPTAPTEARDQVLQPDEVLLHGRIMTDDGVARPPTSTATERSDGDAAVVATVEPEDVTPPEAAGGHYLLDLGAAAIATGAFVSPWAWMGVVALGVLVGVTVRSVAVHGGHPGALAGRAARRVAAWMHPRSIVWFGIVVLRALLLAIVAPAVVCALWWIIDQGTDGAFVAAKVGVWAHAFRLAAAGLCFMIVAGVGEARHRRAAHVRALAAKAGRATVAAVAVAMVLVAAVVVTLVPRADAGPLAAADGLGWAPPRLRDNLDRVRDDVVSSEMHAAGGCLSDHQDGVTWAVGHTRANPPGEQDTARLTAVDGAPASGQIVTAIAALHNQLAPWVESIEIGGRDSPTVVLDRASLPSGRPVIDADDLRAGATTGADIVAEGAGDFDRATSLACSAAPIP